jgi:predicted permease
MFTRIFKDLKHTFKTMGHNPGPFVVAGLTLALGIGACAAIYSVVETVLLRPLPFPEPGRLVAVKADLRGSNMRDIGFSQPEFEDLRLRAGVFEEISVAWPMDGNLTGVDKPHRIEALGVSAGYFDLLGVKPAMGRLFLPEDGEPWMSQSAVLSYHAWQRLFGADPKVLGRKIRLDYDPYVVVGVAPAGFQHPGPTLQGEVDIWLTGCYKGGAFPANPGRTQWRMFPGAIGRLKPGLDTRQAQALLDVFGGSIRRQYAAEYPAAAEWTPGIEGLQQSLAGESRRILLFLLVAVALVLLICCVTVANLVLARTTSRSGEFAVRTALGAGRGDLVLQILIENLVLGVLAGFVALGVVAALAPLLLRAEPLKLPQVNAAGMSAGVVGFVLLAGILSGILSAVTPAFHVSRFDLMGGLKAGGRGTGPSGNRSRAFLIAGQIALSLMLLAGAGLLARSLRAVLSVDPGFRSDGVVLGYVWLPPPGTVTAKEYTKPEKRTAFVREVLRRLQAMPGVEAAALGSGDSIPFLGWSSVPFAIEGRSERADESLSAQMTSITPDYLRVLGGQIVSGREFNEADDGRYRVALINQSMARRFWKGENPLGKRIRTGTAKNPEWCEIVGVVRDMKTGGPEAAVPPHAYFPVYQRSTLDLAVMIRTAGRPEAGMAGMEHEIQVVDSDLAVFALQSLDDVVRRSTAQRRFALSLISAFALAALALAGLGVYGVTAFGVSQRTREIGIRMALGASRSQVLGMILQRGIVLTLAGLAAGLAGSALLARSMQGFLFGTASTDVPTYLSVSALLTAVTLFACYLPARRAARLDPALTLRQE